ncbi:MAG: hypothetical protein ACREFE_13790 [Limisphaerales bacterium]
MLSAKIPYRNADLKDGKPVDRKMLEQQWRAHDLKFATTAASHYAAKPRRFFCDEP